MKLVFNYIIFYLILSSCTYNTNKSEVDKSRFNYTQTFGKANDISEVTIKNNDTKQITVPEDINKHSIFIDSIISTRKLIQLETNNNCLISHIDELLFIDDNIIIADKMKQEKALLFSPTGKFITAIGKKGKGPNEYNSLRDIAIDNAKKEIVIFDGVGKKMLYYNKNGHFIKSRKIFYYCNNMAILNNDCYVYNQLEDQNLHIPEVQGYQIIIADSTQRITYKAFPYNKPNVHKGLNINSLYSFNCKGSKLLFNPRFTNSIYEFQGNSHINLKYTFSLGAKDALNRIANYKTNDEYLKDINKNKLWRFSGFALETYNWLYTKINNAGFLFYNIKTNNLIYGNSISVFSTSNNNEDDKLINNYGFFENIIAVKDSSFVSYIWPDKLFTQENANDTLNFSKLNFSITYSDNPILMFFTLKQN